MIGKLLGIAVREKHRAAMTEIPLVSITAEAGLSGDFYGGRGSANRQVTVLAAEAWQAVCRDHGQDLPWTVRRANLLIEGLPLAHTTGAIITIDNVQLEITGETDPCNRMDEASAGLRSAIEPEWRGGVCCRAVSYTHLTLPTNREV